MGKPIDVTRARLATHRLIGPPAADPVQVVTHLLAVQAQDYRGGLWAIAQRTPRATEADVERALAERTLVRSWPMRGTLHVVGAGDLRWLQRLLAPRVIARAAGRFRELGLDARVFARSRAVLEDALAGGRTVTRPEVYALLARAKISPAGQRGIHILWRLAHDGVLCLGAHRGKQATFALLDEWLPPARVLEGDEALGELARRYFTGHGPATLADLAWWSGLPAGEARRGVEIARDSLVEHAHGGVRAWSGPLALPRRYASAHLLPPFDEYTVGYRDRSACLDPVHAARTQHGLAAVMLIDGRIAGLWKRALAKARVTITLEPFAPLPAATRALFARAADRYGAFVGRPARVELAGAPVRTPRRATR